MLLCCPTCTMTNFSPIIFGPSQSLYFRNIWSPSPNTIDAGCWVHIFIIKRMVLCWLYCSLLSTHGLAGKLRTYTFDGQLWCRNWRLAIAWVESLREITLSIHFPLIVFERHAFELPRHARFVGPAYHVLCLAITRVSACALLSAATSYMCMS